MILDQLKKETASIHEEVEQENLAKYIMDGSIDQGTYERLLRQSFMVYKSVEDFINARYNILPDALKPFSGFKKTNTLAQDIAGFSSLPLPKPIHIVDTRDIATLVGKLYVIEGSMIGGVMISKKLPQCSKLDHIKEHYFFNNNTASSVARWKDFKAAVQNIDFSDQDIERAVASAKDTFQIFKKAYKKQTI